MPRVTYVSHDGKQTAIDVKVGQSVMQAAIYSGIDGIVAECGGSCMCATCHVYVAEDQLARLPPIGAEEEAMLESTASPRRSNSRLSCQLTVTPELDGLTVTMPETQI